jgi:hypothetical protein
MDRQRSSFVPVEVAGQAAGAAAVPPEARTMPPSPTAQMCCASTAWTARVPVTQTKRGCPPPRTSAALVHATYATSAIPWMQNRSADLVA